jgi:hypothetical protein
MVSLVGLSLLVATSASSQTAWRSGEHQVAAILAVEMLNRASLLTAEEAFRLVDGPAIVIEPPFDEYRWHLAIEEFPDRPGLGDWSVTVSRGSTPRLAVAATRFPAVRSNRQDTQ